MTSKNRNICIGIIILSIAVVAHNVFAQNSTSNGQSSYSPFFIRNNVIQPQSNSWRLKIPQLGGSGTKCVEVDNSGIFSIADDECGTGGSGTNYFTNSGSNTYLDTGSKLQSPVLEATSTTATSTFAGAMSVAKHLYVGGTNFLSDRGYPVLENYVADFFRDIDDYVGVFIGNTHDGTSASADLIFNNKNSTEEGGYIFDIGYNGPNYDVSDYGMQNVPNMAYLYNSDGPVSIASATTSTDGYIQFLTGGFDMEAARIESSGNFTIGGIASEGYKLNVKGDVQFQNPDWTDAYIRMNSGAIQVKSSDNSQLNFTNTLTMSSNSTITATTEEGVVIRSGNSGGDYDIQLLPGIGNVGIGTTSPYAKLSVAGQVVADYFTGTSTATSTFAGDISFENAYATVIPLQDTASNLSSIVPLSGQTVYETDTTYTKVGDGVTTVGNLLPTAHIYYTTSNVGVGTTSPYAKLSVAGQVVGEYYTATSTTATSTFSGNVVIGTPRVMAGGSFVTGAFASGYSNTTRDTINSNGKGSFATGYVSSSFGTSSITATGNGAVAIGSVDSSPGGSILATAGSIVVGSAVNGRILKSVGSGSYAGGRAASGDVVSSGTGSFIWGDNATSSGSLSIAFGSGYTNSTNNTFTVGFSSSPTLTVNSTNVGIGTTSPYAKLSVAGQVVADYYTATSTTATSTFSGNVNVIGNGIKFEYLSAPSAPTVALAGAGAGNVNNGSHIYSMTCVTEEGETENSSTNSVTVTNNATDGKVTVTLPTCSSNTTVARKVWRGVANNAFSVYLLTTINDNTTTSYTDNTADASLGNRTPEPTSGPQGGKTGVNTTAGTLRLGDSNTIKINQYGGMNFSSPNASLVFPQNAIKPIVLYNTSNQEQSAAGTGVEYGSMYYSGNILHLGHFIGTVGGSSREVQIHSNGQGSNFYMSLYRGQTAPKGWFDFAESGGTSIGGLTFARFNPDTWTASAGTNTLLNLSGTINMSGTAGYRMLDIAPSETTTGSGEKRLIRAAVNGNELMVLDSMGRLGIGTTTSLTSQLTVSATTTNATSTITIGKPGQNKGSCLELYDAGGSVVYAYVKPGDTTFTLSTVSCK